MLKKYPNSLWWSPSTATGPTASSAGEESSRTLKGLGHCLQYKKDTLTTYIMALFVQNNRENYQNTLFVVVFNFWVWAPGQEFL